MERRYGHMAVKTEQEEAEHGTNTGNESGSGSGSGTGNESGTGSKGAGNTTEGSTVDGVLTGASDGETGSTRKGNGGTEGNDSSDKPNNGIVDGGQGTDLQGTGGTTPNDDESPIERKRRLDRERKQRQREQQRADSTGTTDNNGTRGASNGNEQKNRVEKVLVEKPTTKPPIKAQGTPLVATPKVVGQAARRAKVKQGDIDPQELKMFLQGIFSLLGTVLGSPATWNVPDDEALQIAEPLTLMLNKQNKKRKDKMNEMLTPMLLVSAIGAIIVPRILITLEELKIKREIRRTTKQLHQHRAANTSGQSTSKINTGNGRMASENTGVAQSVEGQSEIRDDEHASSVAPNVPPEVARLFDGSD